MLKIQKPIQPKQILLLSGGWSLERDVSLKSGKAIYEALHALGHAVEVIDPKRNLKDFVHEIGQSFHGNGPELVFNALHGPWGEDGYFACVCDGLGLPYTFSGYQASVTARDKWLTKNIAIAHHVPVAKGHVMSLTEYRQHGWEIYPHVIKPLNEGSTFGVHKIHTRAEGNFIAHQWQHGHKLLVETFISGTELTVAVANGRVLGVSEIILASDDAIFDYQAKYLTKTQHITPARIPETISESLKQYAVKMHCALGCHSVTRSDFRWNNAEIHSKHQGIYYLETNTQPGLTPISLVPDAAMAQGISYEHLIEWIVQNASLPRV